VNEVEYRNERRRCGLKSNVGRAVAQAVSRWFPTATARVRVRAACGGLWWTKRHWGRFSPRTSLSPANHHSTNFSIIIITRGWHNRPIGYRSAEWTQFDSTPPPNIPIKKSLKLNIALYCKGCLFGFIRISQQSG
jgi:hypothetical protein